jgi:hypothetical protein
MKTKRVEKNTTARTHVVLLGPLGTPPATTTTTTTTLSSVLLLVIIVFVQKVTKAVHTLLL